MSPLEKEKGSGTYSGPCRCGKSGEKSTFLGGQWEGLPVSVMLLLTVNVPRSHTAFPRVPETSGSVRNSHSASSGVIPPQEAEGGG